MKKKEILKNYQLTKLGEHTVFIQNKYFNFAYTKVNGIVKKEFEEEYSYFGGLQSGYNTGSLEYRVLEKWLCEIANSILNL